MKYVVNISEYDKEWIKNAHEIPQNINTKIADVIIDAEPLKPEPQWISCNEKLPKENVDVLCQTSNGIMFVASYGILNHWTIKKGWTTTEFNRFSKEVVKAWIPLPEAYKESDEESETSTRNKK